MFMTCNQVTSLCKYIDRISSGSGETKLKQDLVRNSALLAATYRKLITWLVRLPFTKIKPFDKFRQEVNSQMKTFFRLFRRKITDNSFDEMKQTVI